MGHTGITSSQGERFEGYTTHLHVNSAYPVREPDVR